MSRDVWSFCYHTEEFPTSFLPMQRVFSFIICVLQTSRIDQMQAGWGSLREQLLGIPLASLARIQFYSHLL